MTSVDITALHRRGLRKCSSVRSTASNADPATESCIEARDGASVRGVPRRSLSRKTAGSRSRSCENTRPAGEMTGLSEEALAWLYTVQDELGERPIDAPDVGRHHG